MFLFIFESIGTSELLLVGVVALIFLGPRKLPEMARKFGKIMAEFRSTTSEFKETWQREVNFEEESKSLNLNVLEAEAASEQRTATQRELPTPEIKAVDPERLEKLRAAHETGPETPAPADVNDKATWL